MATRPSQAPDREPNFNAVRQNPKDFLEHLRTVHFTLLVVCLGMIVIVLSPSPLAIRKAQEQLKTIADVSGLWKETWLQEMIDEHLKYSPRPECSRSPTAPFYIQASNRVLAIEMVGPNWFVRSRPSQWLPDETPQGFVWLLPKPNQVKFFREIWDSEFNLVCPKELADTVWVTRHGQLQRFPLIRIPPHPGAEKIALTLRSHFHFRQMPGELASADFLFVGDDPKGQPVVIEYGSASGEILDLRAKIIREVPKADLHDMPFKHAFHQLDETLPEFHDAEFSALSQLIDLIVGNSKEVFEAFGIKFPVESTVHWAIFLALGIQLYFWLHLAEYARRDFNNSDIAWIGSYRHWAPQLTFLLTGFILPVFAIVLITFKRPLSPYPMLSFVLATITIILSTSFAALSANIYFHLVLRQNKN